MFKLTDAHMKHLDVIDQDQLLNRVTPDMLVLKRVGGYAVVKDEYLKEGEKPVKVPLVNVKKFDYNDTWDDTGTEIYLYEQYSSIKDHSMAIGQEIKFPAGYDCDLLFALSLNVMLADYKVEREAKVAANLTPFNSVAPRVPYAQRPDIANVRREKPMPVRRAPRIR